MKQQTRYLMITMFMLVLMGGCKKDEDPAVRPLVSSTNPVNKATNIAINTTLSSTFNVAMEASTITSASFTVKQGTTNVAGSATYTGMIASFDPAENLLPNTLYTATISTAAKNTSGTALASNYVWTFTTGAIPDTTVPTVTLSNPSNNATGVSLNQALVITFGEAMDKTTITATTFTMSQGSTAVAGTVTSTGTTATFTPTTALAANTIYTGTITTGVKDLAGNAIASNHVVTFTTGAAPDTALPMVNATDPLNNATGIARNKVIALTFNEAMDPLTITSSTFTLKQGANAVAGTVSYSGMTAKFTSSSTLASNTAYTATITTGAKDLAGNALASNTVWSFTTGGTANALAVVNLGSAGNYVILAESAINVGPTSAITGDLALSPAATSYITGLDLINATGYATSAQVTGKIYAADMADPTPINLTTAVGDMVTAYNDAAGRPSPDFLELGTGDIGGKTLSAGLYKWTSTVTLPSDVTISGGSNDVWIFQISGDLTMSSAVNITLAGGAQAKNIFWQVAGQATIGTSAHFEGIILSKTGITFQTNASINGRSLAQTAVILDKNAVTQPQ
ncbi:MAG: ice-binding family protein [Cyclobacteriaceae bacterium]